MTERAAEVWYRYEDMHYAPTVDEFDRPLGPGSTEVKLWEMGVIKHTPKGVWLNTISPHVGPNLIMCRRFVLYASNKRFACPTKEEAAESFYARKLKQIAIHKARVVAAETAIHILKTRLGIEATKAQGFDKPGSDLVLL